MKRLVKDTLPSEISIHDPELWKKPRLFAYESRGVSGWCFLAKLTGEGEENLWGFVAMNYTNTHPRYVSESMMDALKRAMAQREVIVFDNVKELAEKILNR